MVIKHPDESFSDLFEGLLKNVNASEILVKLRASVELRNKEKLLSEIASLREERRI